MRGRHHNPPPGAMRPQECAYPLQRSRVQSTRRLVKQPEWCITQSQASQRQLPLLPGGQGTVQALLPDPPGQAVPAPRLLTRPSTGRRTCKFSAAASVRALPSRDVPDKSLARSVTAGRPAHLPRPTAPGRRLAAPAPPARTSAGVDLPEPVGATSTSASRLPGTAKSTSRIAPIARRGRPSVSQLAARLPRC